MTVAPCSRRAVSRLLHSASFTVLSTPMRRKRVGSRFSKFKCATWQRPGSGQMCRTLHSGTGQFRFYFRCESWQLKT
jgi:hypothetical protein